MGQERSHGRTGILWHLERQARAEAREAMLALAEENGGARLLDCGCASGQLTAQLGMRVGTSKLYGIDISETNAQHARDCNVDALVADLNAGIPFDDASFDVVHTSQVLEHVLQTDVFIKEIFRVLRPGGCAILSVPNLASAHNILFLLLGWQPWTADVSFEAYVGNPLFPRYLTERRSRHLGHVRLFTSRALRQLIEHHGFRVERLVGSGFYPFPGWISRTVSKIDPTHSVFLTLRARK